MTTDTLCACGCGKLIINPISKRGYKRTFLDGHQNSKKISKYVLPQYKMCNFCKRNLSIDNFDMRIYISKINNEECPRPRSRCRDCENENRKTYSANNKEKVKENAKRYHDKNIGTIKYHVQEKISNWRRMSVVPSDLTVDYLVELYSQQSGNCSYLANTMKQDTTEKEFYNNMNEILSYKGK